MGSLCISETERDRTLAILRPSFPSHLMILGRKKVAVGDLVRKKRQKIHFHGHRRDSNSKKTQNTSFILAIISTLWTIANRPFLDLIPARASVRDAETTVLALPLSLFFLSRPLSSLPLLLLSYLLHHTSLGTNPHLQNPVYQAAVP